MGRVCVVDDKEILRESIAETLTRDDHTVATFGDPIEALEAILFSEGVSKGRITLEQFVALTSTNHAKIYGLYPQKGSIAVGADADLVLWDANRTVTISQDLLHHGADYTPWEGYEVKGWPVKTILRGDVVFDDGKVVGKPGGGRFLKRALSPYAVPNHTD